MDQSEVDRLMQLGADVRRVVESLRPDLAKRLDIREILQAARDGVAEADRKLSHFGLKPIGTVDGINLDALTKLAEDHNLNPDNMTAAEICSVAIELQKQARAIKIAGELQKPESQEPNLSEEAPWHSDDFRTVTVDGETYQLTPTQAVGIRILWEHAEQGKHELTAATIQLDYRWETETSFWAFFRKEDAQSKLLDAEKRASRLASLYFSQKISKKIRRATTAQR